MKNYAKEYFSKFWSKETSHYEDWSIGNPSYGQCAISALALQKIMGGELAKLILDNGDSHYFNIIDGNVYDLTADQFQSPIDYSSYEIVSKDLLLSNTDMASRFRVFYANLIDKLNKPLPKEEIGHVCIRDPNYVAGSAEKPEVKVFCQTNKRFPPINEDKFHPVQNVYMKWTGGPIVAHSKLISWHSGFLKTEI